MRLWRVLSYHNDDDEADDDDNNNKYLRGVWMVLNWWWCVLLCYYYMWGEPYLCKRSEMYLFVCFFLCYFTRYVTAALLLCTHKWFWVCLLEKKLFFMKYLKKKQHINMTAFTCHILNFFRVCEWGNVCNLIFCCC